MVDGFFYITSLAADFVSTLRTAPLFSRVEFDTYNIQEPTLFFLSNTTKKTELRIL